MPDITPLAATLTAELEWFERVLAHRFAAYGEQVEGDVGAGAPPPPPLLRAGDVYADACAAAGLGADERLALVLALAPWLRPSMLDSFLLNNQATGGAFTEFGGVEVPGRHGFMPTVQTALFLIAGDHLADRLAAMRLFARGAPLATHRLIVAPRDAAPWSPLEPHSRFRAVLFSV